MSTVDTSLDVLSSLSVEFCKFYIFYIRTGEKDGLWGQHWQTTAGTTKIKLNPRPPKNHTMMVVHTFLPVYVGAYVFVGKYYLIYLQSSEPSELGIMMCNCAVGLSPLPRYF